MDCDVLVTGAGPTGMMLAIELARRGIACRIIDASEAPFEGSRGKGLQPRTLEIFDHIGIMDEIGSRAMIYPRMKVHLGPLSFGMGSLGSDHPATWQTPWPNMLMLPQWRTEHALRRKLAELGVTIERGKALESLRQDETGVIARLEDGETIQTRFLAGCDGGRSTVRKALGIGLVGETLDGREKVVADLEIPGLNRKFWHNWPTLKGVIVIAPLPEPALFQLQAPAHTDGDDALGGLEAAIGFSPGRIVWKSRFRHQARMAEAYRKGRLLLAGDAAHVHPPSGGQGLNTSIQDAWNLGWKLAQVLHNGDKALLDTYEAERMTIAAGMLKLTRQLHRTASASRGDATNQLGLHYRGGPLSTGVATEGLEPGDRMPNLPLSGEEGVFDKLRDGHGLRLVRDGAPTIHVRPDGYIATIGEAVSPLLASLKFVELELGAS